jgi:hypothetical protein
MGFIRINRKLVYKVSKIYIFITLIKQPHPLYDYHYYTTTKTALITEKPVQFQ